MRYAKDRKENTHKLIVEKAAESFVGNGYAISGIKEVMQSAGLTKGGFYAHFKSKEELLEEVLTLRLGRTLANITSLFEKGESDKAVQGLADNYLSTAHRNNPSEGCPIPRLASELPHVKPSTRKRYDDEIGLIIQEVADHVPLKTSAKKREWAMGFMSMLVGGLVLSRSIKNQELSDELLRATRKKAKELVILYK
ncbi:TetR/AcrR family transcriptional regulator [Gammaproteobacteria bacterium]|jgi:TetR/AcrR family transcriptional repressor of nem operon|nr:TetR/AcrR family transcriptional regulator [Gammaproteobacteria bacterium]|tara:strand:+ start:3160 stop:3747 length:588 start_codon:yes stop_codon:yes gene_type:complete